VSGKDSLVVRTHVKRYALDHAKATRFKKWTRVSEEFLERADAQLRTWIRNEIEQMPTNGKTIK